MDQASVEQKGGLLAVSVYVDTVEMLRTADEETRRNGKNWGEVVSLAMAKALSLPVFLSDESGVQQVVDEHLNLGDELEDERNIRVIRIEDFVVWMRDNGLPRKQGKVLWSAAKKSRDDFKQDHKTSYAVCHEKTEST